MCDNMYQVVTTAVAYLNEWLDVILLSERLYFPVRMFNSYMEFVFPVGRFLSPTLIEQRRTEEMLKPAPQQRRLLSV